MTVVIAELVEMADSSDRHKRSVILLEQHNKTQQNITTHRRRRKVFLSNNEVNAHSDSVKELNSL